MTTVAGTAPGESAPSVGGRIGALVRSTEVDLRQFGMVVALIAIWIGLGIANPNILQPVNFITFSVQASGIAVLATRHATRKTTRGPWRVMKATSFPIWTRTPQATSGYSAGSFLIRASAFCR